MNIRIAFLLITLFLAGFLPLPASADDLSLAKFPSLAEFEKLQTRNKTGDILDIYVRAGSKQGPVMVFLPGSLCSPLFDAIDMGNQRTGLAISVPLLKKQNQEKLGVHIALLERRGLQSLKQKIPLAESDPMLRLQQEPCSERRGGVTLEHRVEDTLIQLAQLRKRFNRTNFFLVGSSEGADVVAALASRREQKDFLGLLLIGGTGTSQFFDFVNQQRNAKNNEGIKKFFSDLDAFAAKRPPVTYLGYPAARWNSFAIDNSPIEHLLKSQVPVFIAHGELDTSVPIASADVMAVEIIRKQPQRALYYWSVADADHGLKRKGEDLQPVVLETFAAWALNKPSGRIFRHE